MVGRLMDLRGPRLVVEIGAVLMGAGLLLAILVHEPWQLYLTLGALVGGGVNCLAYTGQSLYLTNWFVRRRGLALSIAFSGVGLGAVVILPWLQAVIVASGWRTACWAEGEHHLPGLARSGTCAPSPAAQTLVKPSTRRVGSATTWPRSPSGTPNFCTTGFGFTPATKSRKSPTTPERCAAAATARAHRKAWGRVRCRPRFRRSRPAGR